MREADFEVLLHLVERLSDEQRAALGRALASASGEPEAVRLIEQAFAAAPRCPHCGAERLQRWGYASGLRRYRCQACRRTFNALTGTSLARLRKKACWVRYGLPAVRANTSLDDFAKRGPSLWRYRELLPLPFDAEPVTLGEGLTPLLPCPRLGASLGLKRLLVKDESQLPTGSFKSRGMTTAVSMARHFGLKRLAIPTAGNAGGALAAYGARAGMEVYVFMPDDTPVINQLEAHLAGARVYLVNGLITDCGRLVREGAARLGWFDLSTLKEPYRLEGKKTMGLELAEQTGYRLPDVILYPTGGGTGLIGMWKAFAELRALGWLRGDRLPRLIACQSEGCAPIVLAFEAGQRFAEPFP